jgi:hypothetical protein
MDRHLGRFTGCERRCIELEATVQRVLHLGGARLISSASSRLVNDTSPIALTVVILT